MSGWRKVAGLSGALAVGLGAYGAHGFKPENAVYKEVYRTGNQYHLLHSALLATAPLSKRPNLFGGLCSGGILLFSGSCYATALSENREFGKLAPVGGMSLIAAWLTLVL
ncbi:hypothetical protein HOP50_01g06070 [Chloropicon primus]|uniref:DUF423 domain-containing protein n=1 Tax=Chloropicon primus TaxID=1764295 RepID=A0A5B8MCH3_9CHLO|nr:hypothetical protein A3770_01p06210 [Chloropicon primus]UPQ97316.1 hypothetical protein HOP50_01g06070 [Chloropicon primus]|eukprot:QDZ18103.1 hypothetical protein A3770_01p06210 [Chloropicon primus]